MALIVDFHTHFIPDRIRLPSSPIGTKVGMGLGKIRKTARHWMKPITGSLHQSQTLLRVLPETLRRPIDEIGMLAPLAGLLFESTSADLQEAMKAARVDYAVVIAQPPHLDNDHLLEVCASSPSFIPAANISPRTENPGKALKNYVKRGARALKIHAAIDGESLDSAHYHDLLKTATELGVPVILHTGCLHSRIFYKDPEKARVQAFIPWFEKYRETRFVLAHMNIHQPSIALDIAEEHPHLLVDTSWQPSEVIGEAVRRLGPEKVLFGTDWPIIGNNIAVGIGRVRDCVDTGVLSKEDADLVLGKNAECLLNLPSSLPSSS